MNPVRAFATIFMAVFLFILLGSALITFLLPEQYRATARVLAPDRTHLELLKSPDLLKKVSQKLDLPTALAARYGESKPLEEKRVTNLLRRSVQMKRVGQTDIVEIKVYDRSAEECARLANAIAETAAKETQGQSEGIKTVEQALTPLKPSRPNKALNLALGAAVGIFLGIMAGGVGAKLAVGFDGRDTARA